MKPLAILGILFMLYMAATIMMHKETFSVHNSLYDPDYSEHTIIKRDGDINRYPTVSHSRTFIIKKIARSIPSYDTLYDCKERKMKYVTGSDQNWKTVPKNSDVEYIFFYACFSEE